MRNKIGNSPLDCILYLLTFGLAGDPQFKVLKAIVVAYSVFVVDVLVWMKFSAKMFFHNMLMFGDSLAINANISIPRMVNPSGCNSSCWRSVLSLNGATRVTENSLIEPAARLTPSPSVYCSTISASKSRWLHWLSWLNQSCCVHKFVFAGVRAKAWSMRKLSTIERNSTILANVWISFRLFCWNKVRPSLIKFSATRASDRAESLSLSVGKNRERFAAFFANLLNGSHAISPWRVNGVSIMRSAA